MGWSKSWTRGTYNVNSQIKFKTSMLRSSLCDYSDAYTLVSLTITVSNTAATGAQQIDTAKDIDIAIAMYNLIEYSDNYSETSGSLWHYYRDKSFLDNAAITDFSANNNNTAKSLELEK